MGTRKAIRILPLLLAAAFAGCGEDGVTGVNTNCGIAGSANISVTGAVTASVNGCATYVVAGGADPATAVALTGGSFSAPTHSIGFGRDGARPTNGSYTIGAGATQFAGSFTLDGGSGADRSFVLTGGTINITTSNSGTLAGTFSAVTASEISTPGNTVTMSGSFTAKCIDTAGADC